MMMMSKINNFIGELFNYFIPADLIWKLCSEYNIEKYHKNMEILRKIRLTLIINSIMVLNILFLSLFWLSLYGINEPRLFVFPFILFFLIAPMFMLKRYSEYNTMFLVSSVIISFIIPVQMFFTGGLGSISVIWILIQPLLINTLYNFRISLISAAWIILYLMAFFIFELIGYDLPLHQVHNPVQLFFSLIIALTIFYSFIFFNDTEHKYLVGKLKKMESDKITSILEEMEHYKNKSNAFLREYK